MTLLSSAVKRVVPLQQPNAGSGAELFIKQRGHDGGILDSGMLGACGSAQEMFGK